MIDPAALQKYSLFGGLVQDQIEAIRPLLGQLNYAAGELIMKEGEPNDRICFILEGWVVVSKKERLLVELGEGETFGEMELLDVQPAVATIRALVPTKVATISNRALHKIYKKDVQIFSLMVMNLARDLSRRLRHMDDLHSQAEV
ncbi:hypothetical protein MASR2M78_06930 [Treponema sp.]